MKVSTFINSTINKIFEKFPNLNECYYSYDEYSNTHFIKIPSLKLFNSDEFAKLDADISLLFYNTNFEGSLCFISEDSLTTLENCEKIENPHIILSKAFELFISKDFIITNRYYSNSLIDDFVKIVGLNVDDNFNCYSEEPFAIAA